MLDFFLTHYKIIIPVLFFSLAICIFLIKSQKNFVKAVRYSLLLIFAALVLIFLSSKEAVFNLLEFLEMSIIFTFFDGVMSKFTFYLRNKRTDTYIFSHLDKDSIDFALKLVQINKKNKKRKPLVVFANVSRYDDEKLIAMAKHNGFISLSDSELSLSFKTKKKLVFIENSLGDEINLSNTIEVLNKYVNNPKIKDFHNYKIILFSDSKTNDELILNSINKKTFEVIIFDKSISSAYDLAFNNPYFERNNKNNNILVVGCGKVGLEILKSIIWCCQLGKEFNTKIQVLDKDANLIKEKLKFDCPEIFSGDYNLEFIEQDILIDSVRDTLNRYCPNPTYIAISLGNDDLNIKTAHFFRSFYINNDENFSNRPRISLRIKDEMKAVQIRNLRNYDFFTFGEISKTLLDCLDFNSDIDKLALNVHAAYYDEGTPSKEIRESFCKDETNKCSSRSNAIHIKYKLRLLGYDMVKVTDKTNSSEFDDSGKLLKEFELLLQDKEKIESLAKIEHDRWNAFMRTEGWSSATVEQAKMYAETNGNDHKNKVSKLHACICSWENLDFLGSAFNKDFKKYDFVMCEKIPYIIGLSPNENINISEVKYILKRI